jgi:hypothetical protein
VPTRRLSFGPLVGARRLGADECFARPDRRGAHDAYGDIRCASWAGRGFSKHAAGGLALLGRAHAMLFAMRRLLPATLILVLGIVGTAGAPQRCRESRSFLVRLVVPMDLLCGRTRSAIRAMGRASSLGSVTRATGRGSDDCAGSAGRPQVQWGSAQTGVTTAPRTALPAFERRSGFDS